VTTALALITGIILVGLVLQDAFEVMLLPRRIQRRWRFVRLYFRGMWRIWSAVGRRRSAGARRYVCFGRGERTYRGLAAEMRNSDSS
jgi:hypothetical protein